MSWRRKAPDSMSPYLTPSQIAGEITFTLSAQVDEAFRKALSPAAPDKPTPATEASWEKSVGSVTGYRLFRVDVRGRLRPAMTSAPYAWQPGENIAACYQRAPSMMLSFAGPPPMKHNPEHRAPAAGCDCGFYARTVFDASFWDAAFDDFGSRGGKYSSPKPPAILGVIEGYGRTEIGTKGFRCEKSKVLALYVPGRKRKLVEATRLLYPNVQFIDTRAEMFDRWPQFTMTEVAQRDIGPDFWKVGQYE